MSKNKKIAGVTELYYPSIGGIQSRMQSLLEYYVTKGFDVELYCISHDESLPSTEIINGVLVNRITADDNYYKGGRFGRRISTMFVFLFWFLVKFPRSKFDLLIFGQWALLPILSSSIFISKKTYTILDFVEYRYSVFWRWVNRALFASVNHITCISESVREIIVKEHKNLSLQKISVIPNSVNVSSYKKKSNDHYIFLGRLEPHKHPDWAIKAVLAYNRFSGDKKTLHVVGDGSLKSSLQEEFGSNDSIFFHGFVNFEDKVELLSNSKILIFPSEREGLPGVFIECLASHVPIITTNFITNNSVGFVIKEGVGVVAEPTIESIVKSIENLEKNYERFLNAVVSRKNKFDLPQVASKLLKIADL